MTLFIRLLKESDKQTVLRQVVGDYRRGEQPGNLHEKQPEIFKSLPGASFSYWVSDSTLALFSTCEQFERVDRAIRVGLATTSDPIFVRLWCEVSVESLRSKKWVPYAKGGSYSPYYQDAHLVVYWEKSGQRIKERVRYLGDAPSRYVASEDRYFCHGLTYPRRTQKGFNVRVLPADCVFGNKGPSIFLEPNSAEDLLSALALMNSMSFKMLLSLQMAFGSFEVGVVQRTPWPKIGDKDISTLAALARKIVSFKRLLDSRDEVSHAFLLPAALNTRIGIDDTCTIGAKLIELQAEIDTLSLDLYGLSEADRAAVQDSQVDTNEEDAEASADEDGDDEESTSPIDDTAGLLSWAVGVVFGRFDWQLATGERAAPPEPEPFDPLPPKSPGMLPDGADPFHAHAGILVDEPGHTHDLARLIEEVLVGVEMPVPEDVRRWLQRDFFAFHLQRYSKSRRKAPIYWPLSTTSGSYTLWLYYPNLTSQTLYTAINDFIEPKLKQVGADVTTLRNKGSARTRDDEKQFEVLQSFELELIELRDTLLKLAPTYKPNHDDGVQISAAPLWPLFRHKPWQKVLKDTWAKLEKGDYDWANLAMNYWPDRVREECKTDNSLAIAHGLADLYIEPEAKPKKARGKKKAGGDE